MNKNLPKLSSKIKILIICEGYEEFDYFNHLKSCKVWNKKYEVTIKNAKSIDNIAPVYQYDYANGNYKIIFIVCDTELPPYTQFIKLTKSINDFHGKDISKKLVIFSNPCTMQIVLSHFSNCVSLNTNNKTDNSKLIKNLTGVDDYSATEHQRESMMKKNNEVNYQTMKSNISRLSQDYQVVPSSNASILFHYLEQDSSRWIDLINNAL